MCVTKKVCAWCTIPYGAASRCAAMRLAFASRGPVAKNSALHCFLNAPADGAPGSKTCERFRLRVFFCVMCGGKGSSGGAEPHPYNGPRGACVIINAISVFRSRCRVWLRPHLPQLQTPKYSPAPLAGLRCRPLRAKAKAVGKSCNPAGMMLQ